MLSTSPQVTAAPPGILVLEGFVPVADCQALCAIADRSLPTPLSVIAPSAQGTEVEKVRTAARVCSRAHHETIRQALEPLFDRVFREVVPAHFATAIEWFERPQLLCYPAGGEYRQHADSEIYDQARGAWVRVADRDYSAILYLNEDFEGGQLQFPALDFLLRPRTGLLVAFPADHRFCHAALPTDAPRFAAVSWAAARGSARVRPTPRHGVFLS